MRLFPFLPCVILASCPLKAQNTAAKPSSPEELRGTVREWIETMRKIQVEENAWEKDHDVLKGESRPRDREREQRAPTPAGKENGGCFETAFQRHRDARGDGEIPAGRACPHRAAQ